MMDRFSSTTRTSVSPSAKSRTPLGFERPGHRHLVEAQPDLARLGGADAKVIQCLAHVEIGFAGGDDAEARLRRVEHDAVEPVGAGERHRSGELVAVQPQLLLQRRIRPPDIEPARGQREIIWQRDLDAAGIDRDRGRAVHRLGDGLERDPAPGIARHRPAVEPEIEDVLDAGRVEHRDRGVDKGEFRLVRQGRGFAHVVVAGQQQHPAVARRPGRIAVLQRIAAAVDPGPLAVPHGKDAVVFGAGKEPQLLAAPDRRRRHLLVDRRLKADVVALDEAARTPQRLVERAQGRPAVPGDKAPGVEAGRGIALALHHRQAHQGLRAGQINPALLEDILVVERDRRQPGMPLGHRGLPLRSVRL